MNSLILTFVATITVLELALALTDAWDKRFGRYPDEED